MKNLKKLFVAFFLCVAFSAALADGSTEEPVDNARFDLLCRVMQVNATAACAPTGNPVDCIYWLGRMMFAGC